MRSQLTAGIANRRFAVMLLVAVVVLAAGGPALRGAANAQTPGVPGASAITSVTVGDRQLTVNWSSSSTSADRPVVEYQVMYRPGSSGAWSQAPAYSISYDSAVQSGSDVTWAHNRNPLALKAIPISDTSGVRNFIEHTSGGRHDLNGIYKVKAEHGCGC